MTIYTGVADQNGDFIVPFSSSYTGGEKITVAAEKEGALKTIELFAPSEVIGGGVIQFGGTLNDFPKNIGVITLTGLAGPINNYAFAGNSNDSNIFKMATGLNIEFGVDSINEGAFINWRNSQYLSLPSSLISIGVLAFMSWVKIQSVEIPSSVAEIKGSAFSDCSMLQEVIMMSLEPPAIGANVFEATHPNLIIKVPASSLSAYQTANQWSAYASRMVGY
ncbi:leucine-rich repeat protein [Acinetobacter sp. BSP-53]|uniref:leucine-rich repeat protein n=1 Tax=Acinetobacter sp. BSP-53 TaxID=3344662 RepID=UPI00376F9C54